MSQPDQFEDESGESEEKERDLVTEVLRHQGAVSAITHLASSLGDEQRKEALIESVVLLATDIITAVSQSTLPEMMGENWEERLVEHIRGIVASSAFTSRFSDIFDQHNVRESNPAWKTTIFSIFGYTIGCLTITLQHDLPEQQAMAAMRATARESQWLIWKRLAASGREIFVRKNSMGESGGTIGSQISFTNTVADPTSPLFGAPITTDDVPITDVVLPSQPAVEQGVESLDGEGIQVTQSGATEEIDSTETIDVVTDSNSSHDLENLFSNSITTVGVGVNGISTNNGNTVPLQAKLSSNEAIERMKGNTFCAEAIVALIQRLNEGKAYLRGELLVHIAAFAAGIAEQAIQTCSVSPLIKTQGWELALISRVDALARSREFINTCGFLMRQFRTQRSWEELWPIFQEFAWDIGCTTIMLYYEDDPQTIVPAIDACKQRNRGSQ